MKNSIFNCLLKIKSQLTSSITEQNLINSNLVKGIIPDIIEDINEFSNTEIGTLDKAITLENGECIAIHKPANSTTIEYILTRKIAENEYETVNGSFDATEIVIDEPLHEDFSTSVQDVLTSLAHGEGTNEALVKINELFLLNPNVSTSDCMTMIDSVSGLTSSDIQILREFITSISVEGKISNYNWMSLFQSLCEAGSETTDDDELIVKEESFFALQSFMNTVISVVSVVFNVIIVALGVIFKAIGWLIGAVIGAISNLFAATFDTDYKVKANASYPGIAGTLYAGSTSLYTDIDDIDYNQLLRISYGNEDVFTFKSKDVDGSTKIFCQSQITLSYHPTRLRNYITNVLGWNVETIGSQGAQPMLYALNRVSGSEWFFAPWEYSPVSEDDPNDPYLKMEDYIKIGLDKDFMLEVVATNLIALFLCRSGASWSTVSKILQAPALPINLVGKPWYTLWANLTLRYISNNIDTTFWNSINSASTRNDLINNLISEATNVASVNDMFVRYDDTSTLGNYTFVELCFFPLRPTINYVLYGNGHIKYIGDETYAYPDAIPTEDMINLPSVDASTVILALATVSAITIGILVVGKKIFSSIKSKRQSRQAKRVSNLNSLRDAYMKDPDNNAKRDAYRSALRKYNFKASLFGWGSYDSANGWVNASTLENTTSKALNDISSTNKLDDVLKRIGKKED